jgi:hypothetical protein
MKSRLHRRSLVLLAALAPFASLAQTVPGFGPVPAIEVVENEWLYVKRPVIIFADSPNDPSFIRQMELLSRSYDELEARDVLLIIDTTPEPPSPLRLKLRPRGFSLVLMDKDWRVAIRKPLPWEGREIINSIDKMPIARAEALEKNPAGR